MCEISGKMEYIRFYRGEIIKYFLKCAINISEST